MQQSSRHTGSRYKQHTTSAGAANGCRSVMSVRSFAAFEKDDAEDENGANIPDILRRRSSLGTSIAETVASPATFRKIWAETANLSFLDHSRRPQSVKSNPERGLARLVITTETDGPQSAETRSPSSPPKSLLSQSTKSRVNSSSSSLAPAHSNALHGLQSKIPTDHDGLEPLAEEDVDPASFDLVSPCNSTVLQYSLEARSEALFSTDHLKLIFNDPLSLSNFTDFLYAFRPKSIPLLTYHLDALKASKAIDYANSIAQSLVSIKGLEFGEEVVRSTFNESLLERANKAFGILAGEDLPAYVTHTWIQTVSVTLKRRMADTLPLHLRDLSGGLAEAFCLTDPSRDGNPIVFASEEFHKMTQYGMGHVLGRNCRFLQGPKTNPSSMRRIREHLEAGKEHCETLLNYRRDGSPFMNLLMVAPLFDSRGRVRYHIGAQVDVSGLAKECGGLESLKRLVAQNEDGSDPEKGEGASVYQSAKRTFCELVEMFNPQELKTVRERGAANEEIGGAEVASSWDKPRLPMTDNPALECDGPDSVRQVSISSGGRLGGILEHYLLVRPYPNLRVLFASPSMRFPGMLQSSFMSRIGGSSNVHEAIIHAFADNHGFTAKIRWVTRTDSNGKGRWIHCTPLLGANGAVGVWMVVLVEDEAEAKLRRRRTAPPVEVRIGGRKPFDEDTTSLSSPAKATGEPHVPQPSSASRYASESRSVHAHTPGSTGSVQHETEPAVM
ncbi:hypothetical protein F4677DRAFT_308324 [Hypoxylon crocopeplum]|nr:hypothetical protein F4677DRAFT_308324 [Hypoxylon crocopeplum]